MDSGRGPGRGPPGGAPPGPTGRDGAQGSSEVPQPAFHFRVKLTRLESQARSRCAATATAAHCGAHCQRLRLPATEVASPELGLARQRPARQANADSESQTVLVVIF